MLLTIKNYHLDPIGRCLNYQTTFQKGRSKMRFVKLLSEKDEIFQKSRTEMLKEFSNKDGDNKPMMKDALDGKGNYVQQYDLSAENLIKFNKEFSILLQEECPIDVPKSMESDLTVIQQLINESTVKELSNHDVMIIEEFLVAITDAKTGKKPEEKKTEKKAVKAKK